MTEGESGSAASESVEDVMESSGGAFKPFLNAKSLVQVREMPEGPLTTYSVVRNRLEQPGEAAGGLERFLLLGFDTEYQSLKPLFRHDDVRERKARYEVASYQGYAKIDGIEFREIVIPTTPPRRMSLVDFITFLIAKITSAGVSIPRSIVLVGHFNKADLPAFDDREQVFAKLMAIRNSLVTHAYPIKIRIQFSDDEEDFEEVRVHIRDSILMAPTGKRSLEEVGKLIGMQKIKLHDDPAEELHLKRNIKLVRDNMWPLFRDYALLDAEISALYFERLTEIYRAVTGSKLIPTALSNIGVKLLLNEWKSATIPIERLEIIGRERIKEEVWNNDTGSFITYKEEPFIPSVHWNVDFATECYHGGRSEQMWFGPSDIADFSDYDIVGAYPTAMAMLKAPKWNSIRETKDINDLRLGHFAFAWVNFIFPETVRYPTLPVRTSRGLVFPQHGDSYCCAPEIELALNLGAKIYVKRGLVTDTSAERVFEPFIAKAIRLRGEAVSELEQSFWKEVTNSCYGKTAQGLREKRAFNLKTKKSKPIPQSPITNPFFAAYITSLVRAMIGEVINGIPHNKIIFSVTTDGFLTDAGDEEIRRAAGGPIAKLFSEARGRLTANHEVLGKKHSVKRLLGCRTRGQSTLVPDASAGNKGIVLAKAGIKTPAYTTNLTEQNDYIVETFLARVPGQKFVVDTFTTMREIMLFQADLVMKTSERAISLEYDFKRRPAKAWDSQVDYRGKSYSHLAFSTEPWRTLEEFNTARQLWESHSHEKVRVEIEVKGKDGLTNKSHKIVRRQRYCLKTTADFRKFATFHDMKIAVKGKGRAYIRSDLSRLRLDLCTAYQHGAAGLAGYRERYTAQQFADILNRCGFEKPVTRSDVEYGMRRKFTSHTTPPTEKVIHVLRRLSKLIPSLRADQIVASMDGLPLLSLAV
jgi:hypothetical protein